MASTHHSPLGSPKRPCGGLELEADICRQTHQFRTDLSADAVATLYACFMTTWVRVRDGWRTVELHFDQPRATTRSISYFLTRPFPRWYSTFFLAPEAHDDFGAPPLPGSLATDQARL